MFRGECLIDEGINDLAGRQGTQGILRGPGAELNMSLGMGDLSRGFVVIGLNDLAGTQGSQGKAGKLIR